MRNNKKLAILMVVLIIVVLFPFQKVKAEEVTTPEGIVFDTATGTVVSYDGNAYSPLVIPQTIEGVQVQTIGVEAFRNFRNIQGITLPEGLHTIEDRAFDLCESLTTFSIPTTVTSIGEDVFHRCSALTSINVNSGNTEYSSINGVLFHQTELKKYPEGKSDEIYTIPTGTQSIGIRAFYDCQNLCEVYMPSSLTAIMDEAFSWSGELIKVGFSDGITYIGTGAFERCDLLDNVVLPDGVENLSDYLFNNCISMSSITLPGGLTGIGNHAFDNCYSMTGISIPGSVTSIGIAAFQGSGLTHITIPGSVNTIGDSAFSSSTQLSEVTIEYGVTEIGSNAFNNAYSITSITIPNSVTTIGESAFADCASLPSISLPEGITSLSWGLFDGCHALADFEIPASVTSIGDITFRYCTALTEISIPDDVSSLGEGVFSYCSALTSVTISNSVTSIGADTFKDCISLVEADVPSSMTIISESMFDGCESLKHVTIYDGITSIGVRAFDGCQALKYISIPSTVAEIGEKAFLASGLEYANFYGDAPSMGDYVFNTLSDSFIVYYLNGAAGFTNPWYGYTTQAVDQFEPVTGVTLDKNEAELFEGDELTLYETVSPENAANKRVIWSSDNESVATVAFGNVEAVAAGTAVITVTTEDGEYTDTCTLTVNEAIIEQYLTELVIDSGFIEGGFDEDKKQFTINVQSNVTSIALTPVLSDTSGSASINRNETTSGQPIYIDLVYGKNIVSIITALQDGTETNEYTLYIYRQAGEWVNIGGKICDADSSTDPDIKVNDGIPYVAWNGEGGYLYEYTGSVWEATPQIRPGIWLKDIALEFDEGVPYVGYLEGLIGHGRGYAAVKKYNGSSWTLLDSTGSSGSAEYFSMTMYNGIPYIAYIDGAYIYVQKYYGSEWCNVGDFSSFTNNPDYTALAIDQATGTPYIAYKSSEYKVVVRRFNGDDWEAVGEGVLFSGSKICLEVDNGMPYIGIGGRVYKVTESSWEDMGCPSDGTNTSGDNFDFAINGSKLYYIFGDAESKMLVLKTYNESGWTTVGATTQQGYKPELIFDNDEPYIVYLRYVDNWPAVFVDRFESLNIDTAKSYMSIAINTSADQLKSELAGEADEIKIYTTGGSEYFGDAVATGMVVKLIENEIVREERTAVVLGDVNNDGVINISDYTLVRLDILNLKPLVDEYLLASDVNDDSFTNITDYTLIRLDILNLKSIH